MRIPGHSGVRLESERVVIGVSVMCGVGDVSGGVSWGVPGDMFWCVPGCAMGRIR